jgi:hypothetical protein
VALALPRLKSHPPQPQLLGSIERRLGKQGPFHVPIRTTKSQSLNANLTQQQPSRWPTDDAGVPRASAERKAKNLCAQVMMSRPECRITNNQECAQPLKRWCTPRVRVRAQATSTSHVRTRGTSLGSVHSLLRLPSADVYEDVGAAACLRLGIPRPRR